MGHVLPHVWPRWRPARLPHPVETQVADSARLEDEGHHRDIKPANILLQRGEPLVADFGIALAVAEAGGNRITETGLSLGTRHYMSPEQASGERSLDPRSDVYALGSVLYEMLAGQPPHAGPTTQAILARILTDEARPVRELRTVVPPNVDAAVSGALSKLPADRIASAAELRRALEDLGYRRPSSGPAAELVDGASAAALRRWRAATIILGGRRRCWPACSPPERTPRHRRPPCLEAIR